MSLNLMAWLSETSTKTNRALWRPCRIRVETHAHGLAARTRTPDIDDSQKSLDQGHLDTHQTVAQLEMEHLLGLLKAMLEVKRSASVS